MRVSFESSIRALTRIVEIEEKNWNQNLKVFRKEFTDNSAERQNLVLICNIWKEYRFIDFAKFSKYSVEAMIAEFIKKDCRGNLENKNMLRKWNRSLQGISPFEKYKSRAMDFNLKILINFHSSHNLIRENENLIPKKVVEKLLRILDDYWLNDKDFFLVFSHLYLYYKRKLLLEPGMIYFPTETRRGPKVNTLVDATLYKLWCILSDDPFRRNIKIAKFINYLAGYNYITAKKVNDRINEYSGNKTRLQEITKFLRSNNIRI